MLYYLVYCYSFKLIFLNHHSNKLLSVVRDSAYSNALATAPGTIRTVLLFTQLVALMHELLGHASEPNLGRVQELDGFTDYIHDSLLFIICHEGHASGKRCI